MLYEAVREERAYMDEVGKTKDKTKTKDYKYKTIACALSKDPAFLPFLPLSAETLKKKYMRKSEKVSVKYALEREGSNLSALSEKDIVDPLELMLYSMKVKELKYSREREFIKAKDKKRQEDMLTHEGSVLAKDGRGGLERQDRDSDGEFEVEGFNKENEQSQMRKRKREAKEKGLSTAPKTPGSSEEEEFASAMKELLNSLKPSEEMKALLLKEKEAEIKAKEAATENRKAMTQMMMAFLNR